MKPLPHLYISLLFAFVATAFAQTPADKTSLYSEIDSNLPSGTGALTAANLRLTLKDITASAFVPLTDGTVILAGGSYANPTWLTSLSWSKITASGTPSSTTYLRGDGSWATPAGSGSGTVTSIGVIAPSFLSVSGSPVTGAGTITLSLSGTPLPVVNGGTGTATPSLVAGSNISVTGSWPNQTINSTGSGSGTVTHTVGGLTSNALVVGNGSADTDVLASLGTTTTVLHGNAAGRPTFGALNLASDTTGILPVSGGGTGTNAPGLVPGSNITITGSWPNQTITAAASSGMTNALTTAGDLIYSSSGTTPARLPIGSAGQVLTVASGIPSWGTSAASSIKQTYTQTSHGFSAGNAVYRTTGGAWAKAIANAVSTSDALGIVESAPDANTFVLVMRGEVTMSGLTAGNTYYVSPTTAGTLTTTEPLTGGSVSKPMLTAITSTLAIVTAQRGVATDVDTAANLVFAGPLTGSAAQPDFRSLVAADLPIVPVAKGGTGTATPGIVAGSNIAVTGTWPNQTVGTSNLPQEVGFVIDGGGSVITTGASSLRPMPYAGTITGWQVVGDVSGSITVDIQKGTPSGGTVTLSSIVASAPPTLSAQQASSNSSLTGWTTSFAAGDVFKFVVTGTPATVTKVALALKITR